MNDKPHLRILDANLNRAREGLRVAEEYARFVLEDKAVSKNLKQMRHNLKEAAEKLEASLPGGLSLVDKRDTVGDVGTSLSIQSETTRQDASQVALTAAKRLQEALRVLEEYGKVESPEAARIIEKIRYESYTMEKMITTPDDRKKMLAGAKLYVLVTGSLSSADPTTACREAVAGGADIIQMREKEMEDGEFHELAMQMAAICREGGALFLINDRPHIASLVQADGIHTGQWDLPVNMSRRILEPGMIIGRSTNSPEKAQQAAAEGADYIGVGPVYPTKTKEHRASVGLEYVKWASENSPLPYFCIGSINRKTIDGVLEAGAEAVAVCTGIIGAKDIAAEAAWYKEKILSYQEAG